MILVREILNRQGSYIAGKQDHPATGKANLSGQKNTNHFYQGG
jgi:hypothetical protein